MGNHTAIYVRISSDPSGQRAGVERQRKECRQLADALGLTVVEIHEDNDVSAFSGTARPAFDKLLADAAAGRYAAVIVWAADRLYRRLADLERIVSVFDAAGVQVHAVKSGDIDLSTADGRLHARLLGSVAQHESEKKSERLTARARQRAIDERRTVVSRLPFGWRWTQIDGRRDVEPDPATAPALAMAYQDLADGYSLNQTHKRLAARTDVGIMRASTLGKILRNPRNAGLAQYKGEVVGEAAGGARIVEPELWRRVHTILTDPARRTSPGRPTETLLSGILRCGKCGGPMSASKRDGTPVYVCSTHHHLNRRRALLDDLVTARVADVLAALASRGLLAADDDENDPAAGVRARISALETKISALDAELGAERLDVIDYTRAVSLLRKKIDEAAADLVKVSRRPALAALAGAGDVRAAWDGLGLSERRRVLAELLEDVTATTGRTVTFRWRSWLSPDPAVLVHDEPIPAPVTSGHRDRIETAMGASVADVAAALRAEGASWRAVAREISQRSGITTSHGTVRKWAA